MIRSIRLNLIVAAAVFLTVGSATAETTKPFKVVGVGIVDYVPLTVDTPVDHNAVGVATGLGLYYGEGAVKLNGFTTASTADFSSAVPFVFRGASGDKLTFTYGDTNNGAQDPGSVELVDVGGGEFVAIWLAEFNPVPSKCTGQFKKVIGGSFMMLAVTEPFVLGAFDPVPYGWIGSGSLKFK